MTRHILIGIAVVAVVAVVPFIACEPSGKEPPSEEVAPADAPSAPEGAPTVVSSVPPNDAADVDPALSEIRVTCDREMMAEQMWSWVQESADTFPKVSGDIHYLDDKRTCVLPCSLEPGHAYVVWANSTKFDSFRDTDGVPAVPYRLAFT
ncbi:MAG: Ig-like domain-containing protein, partial [bacterium]|nr:Ig-like domain-containing protein [bacterium]